MSNTLEGDIKCLKENKPNWNKIENQKFEKYLRAFYDSLENGLKQKLEKVKNKDFKSGHRKYKIDTFQGELKKLFNNVLDGRAEVITGKLIPIKQFYNRTKKIDIQIEKPNYPDKPVFYFELKYSLEFNSLGAALLEAMILNKRKKDKFYVISLFDKRGKKKNYYSEICKTPEINKYINGGYVSFCPEYDPDLSNVIHLLDKIDKAF